MSDLIVYVFDDQNGSVALKDALVSFRKAKDFPVFDAAVVKRAPDGGSSMYEASSLAGSGRWGGPFWGMLIGLVFWAQWLDLSIGAALNDLDLDDEFVKQVGEALGKDQSALLLVVPSGTAYTYQPVLQNFMARVIKASISEAAESRLNTIFIKEA